MCIPSHLIFFRPDNPSIIETKKKNDEPHISEEDSSTQLFIEKPVILTFNSPAEKFLNFLIEQGFVDKEWNLTENYRKISLKDMQVLDENLKTLLSTIIFPNEGSQDPAIIFTEFLNLCLCAASPEKESVEYFVIHGSYVAGLIGLANLKNKLCSALPGIKNYIEHVNPRFSNSDIDLKIRAKPNIARINFCQRLSELITQKIAEKFHFEISEYLNRGRRVQGFTFNNFLKHLSSRDDITQITAIRIYLNGEEFRKFIDLEHISEIHKASKDGNELLIKSGIRGLLQFPKITETFEPDNNVIGTDVESVKFPSNTDEIDLAYHRPGTAEEARTAHQTLNIKLPSLKIKGHLQGVLDLICGVGHWIKEKNDVDDWPGYLWMVTRGIRFPNCDTELMLKSICMQALKNSYILLREHLDEFKKLKGKSQNFKTVYMLNICETLQPNRDEQTIFFKGLTPKSKTLEKLSEMLEKGSLSYKTARATMILLAYRALFLPEKDYESLPFQVNLTMHKGVVVFRLQLSEAIFFLPVSLRESWEEICEYTNQDVRNTDTIIELVKAFGGLRRMAFAKKDQIKEDLKTLGILLDLDVPMILKGNLDKNALINKLGSFLLFARTILHRDPEAVTAVISRFSEFPKHPSQIDHLLKCSSSLPLRDRPHFQNTIQALGTEAEITSSVMHHLLYIGENNLFNFGAEIARRNPHKIQIVTCFSAVQYHIESKRIGKAVTLLEIISENEKVTQEELKDPLNQIIALLHSWKVLPEERGLFHGRLGRFIRLLIKVLNAHNVETSFIRDWSALESLFNDLAHDALSIEFNSSKEAIKRRTKKSQFQQICDALKKRPTIETVLKLLDLLSDVSLQNLFNEVGSQTDFIQLLAPILIQLLKYSEYFEPICRITALDYQLGIEFYLCLLRKLIKLEDSEITSTIYSTVLKKTQEISLSDEQQAQLLILNLSMDLKNCHEQEKITDLSLEERAKKFLRLIKNLSPKKASTLLTEFYTILIKELKENKPLPLYFGCLCEIKLNFHHKFISKENSKILRHYDHLIIELMFQQYRPEYHSLGLKMIEEYLFYGSVTKIEIDEFTTWINNALKVYSNSEHYFAEFVDHLFDLICCKRVQNSQAKTLQEIWFKSPIGFKFIRRFFLNIHELSNIGENSTRNVIPGGLIKLLQKKIKTASTWLAISEIGNFLTSNGVPNLIQNESYLDVLKSYYRLIFNKTFCSEGPFLKISKKLWTKLFKLCSKHFSASNNQIKSELHIQFHIWVAKIKSTLRIQSDLFGALASTLLSVHENLILKCEPQPVLNNQEHWDKSLVYLKKKQKETESIKFLTGHTNELPDRLIFLIVEVALECTPIDPSLYAVRNSFVIHLLNQVKNVTDDQFLNLFDKFTYTNHHLLDGLSGDLFFFSMQELLRIALQKSFLKKLTDKEQTEKEIEYRCLYNEINHAKPLKSDNINNVLFGALEKFRENKINYLSPITINLFQFIYLNVDKNNYLKLIQELKEALNTIDHTFSTPYHNFILMEHLIETTIKFMESIRKKEIGAINYSDNEFLFGVFSIIDKTLHRIEGRNFDKIPIALKTYSLLKLANVNSVKFEELTECQIYTKQQIFTLIETVRNLFEKKYMDATDLPASRLTISTNFFNEFQRIVVLAKQLELYHLTPTFYLVEVDYLAKLFNLLERITGDEKNRTIYAILIAMNFGYSKGTLQANPERFIECQEIIISYLPDYLNSIRNETGIEGHAANLIYYDFIVISHELFKKENNPRFVQMIAQLMKATRENFPELNKRLAKLIREKHSEMITTDENQ